MRKWFDKVARQVSCWLGTPAAFCTAFGLVVVWLLGGFAFGFSDTYQLLINTSTTIVTFLMVFLIQNTQNRNDQALQLKLDEVLRANDSADNRVIAAEDLSEQELREAHERYLQLSREEIQDPAK